MSVDDFVAYARGLIRQQEPRRRRPPGARGPPDPGRGLAPRRPTLRCRGGGPGRRRRCARGRSCRGPSSTPPGGGTCGRSGRPAAASPSPGRGDRRRYDQLVELVAQPAQARPDRHVDRQRPARHGERDRPVVARLEPLEHVEAPHLARRGDGVHRAAEDLLLPERHDELVLQGAPGAVHPVPILGHVEDVVEGRQVLDGPHLAPVMR